MKFIQLEYFCAFLNVFAHKEYQSVIINDNFEELLFSGIFPANLILTHFNVSKYGKNFLKFSKENIIFEILPFFQCYFKSLLSNASNVKNYNRYVKWLNKLLVDNVYDLNIFFNFMFSYNFFFENLKKFKFSNKAIAFFENSFKKQIELVSELQSGIIVGFKDSIVTIKGLRNVMLNELIFFDRGFSGLVLNLETVFVKALIFAASNSVFVGDTVRRSNFLMRTPVSDLFLGRVINALGTTIDGLGALKIDSYMNIENKALGVITRKKVSEPVVTGVKVIDALVPIGRGQRELILGDRKTGKTTVAVDSILNQTKTFLFHEFPLICIYVAIGKRKTEVSKLWKVLNFNHSNLHTIFIASTSSDPASMQFIAPYVGCTIAEFFLFNSKHTLVIYDDLSKHADVYRQISLLLRRPVGREAYPGDIFYLHSRLLERAVKLNENFGEGSMTALPIVETIQGDVSAYIPTNIISITDGQIYLDWDRHQKGIRPAIDPGISVSRIGTSAQVEYMRKFAGLLKLELAQFREVEQFSKLGSELDVQTLKMLKKGELLVEILKQKKNKPIELAVQIFNLFLVNREFPKVNNNSSLVDNYNKLIEIFGNYSSFFVPFKHVLNLIDKSKRNEILVDLEFLANVFWKLYFLFKKNKNTKWFLKDLENMVNRKYITENLLNVNNLIYDVKN